MQFIWCRISLQLHKCWEGEKGKSLSMGDVNKRGTQILMGPFAQLVHYTVHYWLSFCKPIKLRGLGTFNLLWKSKICFPFLFQTGYTSIYRERNDKNLCLRWWLVIKSQQICREICIIEKSQQMAFEYVMWWRALPHCSVAKSVNSPQCHHQKLQNNLRVELCVSLNDVKWQ